MGIWCAAVCFALAVYFMRATNGRPYKNNKTLSLPVGAIIDRPHPCSHYLSATTYVRTYQEPSPAGEGGSRRLTDEVSVSLIALSYGK